MATPVPAPASAGNSPGLQSWLFTFLSPWHGLCLQSHSRLHAEVFLPQLPVAAVLAADRLRIPVSSRGINASTTERQGDTAVLDVSLPAGAFSLTPRCSLAGQCTSNSDAL